MFIRWASLRCLTVLLVVCQASPQAAKRSCGDAGTISLNAAFDDLHSSAILTYNLGQPDKVSNVHIEVWDGPRLLFRTQVSNERSGRIVWSPKEGILETPSELRLKIHVPEDVAGSYSYLLTDLSRALIGRTGSVDGDPVPKLWNNTAILEEGAGSTSLITEANDVSEHNTVILLMEEESRDVWIAREYLPAVLVDLGHVAVEIPAGYLAKPTRLRLEAARPEDISDVPVGTQTGGDFDVMTIYVMSKDRPVFSKIEPSKVTYEAGYFDGSYMDAVVHILGSGFGAESEILAGFPAGVGHDSNALKPVFISSGELQVQIPGYPPWGRWRMDWRSKTTYCENDDFLFPSEKLNGTQPRTGSMVVEDYLRPAAAKGWRRSEGCEPVRVPQLQTQPVLVDDRRRCRSKAGAVSDAAYQDRHDHVLRTQQQESEA